MIHRIEYLPAAARFLRKLRDREMFERLRTAVEGLGSNPRPVTARSLTGFPYLRLRVGDYRIIYRVDDDRLMVVIITIGHRREVYR